MNKNLVLLSLAGLMAVVLVFQTLQLMQLQEKITGVSLAAARPAQTAPAGAVPEAQGALPGDAQAGGSGSQAALPGNINNLPDMVGGC